MSCHSVGLQWINTGPDFLKRHYSREHTWRFDGGAEVMASPSPQIVPGPWSNPAAVDPEEAFVAAVASCHLLWFLHVAIDAGFEALSYEDHAVGEMTPDEQGRLWISRITLRPRVMWREANRPDRIQERELHQLAHHQCFIANSVRTAIEIAEDDGDSLSV